MAAPLVGAGIGAVTSMAMGRDPLQGALLGGVGGGLFGGAGGIGSGFKELGTSGLFGSAVPSAGGTVATSAPTLGGLELAGATTGAVGGATTTAGTIGAGASDYVGRFVPENLVNSTGIPMDGATSALATGASQADNMPLLMTTEGAKGTPSTAFDKLMSSGGGYSEGDSIAQKLYQADPSGSTMLAQSLFNPPTAQTDMSANVQPIKRGVSQTTAGTPLDVKTQSDLELSKIPVGDGVGGALMPYRTEGFGGVNMIREPKRKFY